MCGNSQQQRRVSRGNARALKQSRLHSGTTGPSDVSWVGSYQPIHNTRFDQIRSVCASPAPHASTCGMDIVHMLLTRRISDSPAALRAHPSELQSHTLTLAGRARTRTCPLPQQVKDSTRPENLESTRRRATVIGRRTRHPGIQSPNTQVKPSTQPKETLTHSHTNRVPEN